MQRQIDEDLKTLKEKLLRMAALVEENIRLAVEALKERNQEKTQQVFLTEKKINALDVEIDKLCLQLLALRQPMAIDLRLITSAMKIEVELERIGDQAVNICERTLELLKYPPLKPLIDIPRMAELAQGMVKDALDAFVHQDDDLAREVCIRDDEVDELNNQIFRELLTYMMEDPKTIRVAVELMLVGRHLERIADHATNIGEDVIYYVKGKTIKYYCEQGRRRG